MKRALLLALLLGGCTVGPDYKSPDMQMPSSYGAPGQVGAPLSLPVIKPPALRTPRLTPCRVRSFSPGRLCAITQPALPRGLKRSTAWSFPKG